MSNNVGVSSDLRVINAAVEFRILEYISALRVQVRPSLIQKIFIATYTVGVLPVLYIMGVITGIIFSHHAESEKSQLLIFAATILGLCGMGIFLCLKEGANSNRVAITLLANRHLMDGLGVTAFHVWIAYRVIPLSVKIIAALLFGIGVVSAAPGNTGRPVIAVVVVVMTAVVWLTVATATSVSNFYDLPERRSLFYQTIRFVATVLLVAVGSSMALILWSYYADISSLLMWSRGLTTSTWVILVVSYISVLFVFCGASVLYLGTRVSGIDFTRPLRKFSWQRFPRQPGYGLRSIAALTVVNEIRFLPVFAPLRSYARLWWAMTAGFFFAKVFVYLNHSAFSRLPEIALPASHALYLVCALTAFFAGSEVGNKIGFRARAARYRYLDELGVPPKRIVAAYFLSLCAVSSCITIPIGISFVIVATTLNHLVISPFIIATSLAGAIIGMNAPAVAENLVRSPMNADGSKRIDMAESIVGMAIAGVPVMIFVLPKTLAIIVLLLYASGLTWAAITRSMRSMQRTPQWIS